MSAAHTPGPWQFISTANDHGKVICREESIDNTVCVLEYDNAASNGKLIAAAPELLAALRELVPIVSAYIAATHDDASAVSLRIARAAIARAAVT